MLNKRAFFLLFHIIPSSHHQIGLIKVCCSVARNVMFVIIYLNFIFREIISFAYLAK